MATDPIKRAIDDAVNARQGAALLAAQLEGDQAERRRAIERAAHALATPTPKEEQK